VHRFRILGPIEVDAAGGGSGRVRRGRTLSFLALLLVNRGAIVPVDRVVEELWDGAGPQHARKAVHVVASRLRAALGEGVLLSEGGGYALSLSPGALDAERFEELLTRGRKELTRGEPLEAAATLRQALALWRGPALADVGQERFAQPEVARLEDLRLACLGDRLDADLACGRHAEVAGELEGLVRLHPLRERFRGQQMLALYRAGRQADALAAYHSAHRALVDGLGIEPSPQLRALEAAILRQDVGEALSPEPSIDRVSVAPDSRRRVTCLFSRLADPVELVGLDPELLRSGLERFYGAARTISARHGGTVIELRSDAVVTVFGIPVAHEDDALRALRAAIELGARSGRPLGRGARSGVCTGDVVASAGDTGGLPVIGEPVASAESLARSAKAGEIRVGESTWQLVGHAADGAALPEGGFLLRRIADDAPAIGRRLDRPLVGREAETERLRETFARVVAGREPELLTILGEPGIGKSRLVAELNPIAGDRGTVLTGRCPPYGEGITYWPLREIVLQATGGRSVDELAAELGIPPAVGHQVAAAVGLENAQAGEKTEWALLRLIEALARVRPLVIVIDDAHWAEPTLLEVLLDLLGRLRDAPVLMVWVARPELYERPAAWTRRVATAAALTLGALSGNAIDALLEAVAGGRLEPDQERRIAEAAGGNPLFLEQLVAYVGERRSTDALPPAIHALLSARLDLLDTAERSALALGAVAGEAFEAASVHALADGFTRAEVDQACDRLVDRKLLASGEPGAPNAALRFRHALIRDAAYASLAKSARARLHERHATWLAELATALPEADAKIGFHLETACRLAREIGGRAPPELSVRAGRRLAAAARVAQGRGDLPGQIGFLERAVALLGSDHEEGAELLPAMVSALFEAGSSNRAEGLADLAVSASASLGLPGVHAVAAVERERIRLSLHPETARVEAVSTVAERSASTLRELGDEAGLARAEYLMSDLSWLKGDSVTASVHARRMLDHARRAGNRFDAATAITVLAWNLVEGPCPAPEGIKRCDSLTREAAGQHAAELSVLGCRAVLLAMTGGYDQARSSMARARQGLSELGLGEMAAYLALLDAMAETLAGDPAAAERAVLDAAAIASESGDRWFLSTVHVDLAQAIIAQGRRDDAAEAVARIDSVPAPCDSEWVIKRHAARALLAIRAADPQSALAEATAAVTAADSTSQIVFGANAYRTLADALQAADRPDEALRAAGRAVELDEAKANVIAASKTRRRFPSLRPTATPAAWERVGGE
jgi:DNA-binding SARP family transcriptional activator/tetratricopeptide (TPR) repeat protein